MNKNGKAAIAVGAAILLLLGGGGTLAVWNSTANVSGGTVYAGTLKISGTPEGKWYHAVDLVNNADPEDETPDGLPDVDENGQYLTGAVITDTTEYALVPGDQLVFKVEGLTLEFLGGNLYYYYALTGLDDNSAAGYTVSPVAVSSEDDFGAEESGTFLPTPDPIDAQVYYVHDDVTGAANANQATVDASVLVSFGSAVGDDDEDTTSFSTLTLDNAEFLVQQVIKQ